MRQKLGEGRTIRLGDLASIGLYPGLWWVRLGSWGKGLRVKNANRHPLRFSERKKLRWAMQVGPWHISALRKASWEK